MAKGVHDVVPIGVQLRKDLLRQVVVAVLGPELPPDMDETGPRHFCPLPGDLVTDDVREGPESEALGLQVVGHDALAGTVATGEANDHETLIAHGGATIRE